MSYRKSDLQFSIGCRERGQIFISKYEAYHLNLSAWQITSSEKLFLYEKYTNNFSTNFVIHLSQKQTVQSCSNFHSIFGIIRNRAPPLFSVITQPWRHPGAILCFHMIIHIFITNHHKLPKFRVHMECDQTIKSHKNIKLIWGHLGYWNEGQRSNIILFCIWETVGPIEPKFWYVVAERILYKKYDNYFSFWWRHHSQIID